MAISRMCEKGGFVRTFAVAVCSLAKSIQIRKITAIRVGEPRFVPALACVGVPTRGIGRLSGRVGSHAKMGTCVHLRACSSAAVRVRTALTPGKTKHQGRQLHCLRLVLIAFKNKIFASTFPLPCDPVRESCRATWVDVLAPSNRTYGWH
jgi:hypothetical protein